MSDNLPVPSFEITPFELLKMSLADFVEDGLPHHTITNLLFLAEDEVQFHAGMQAAIELKDIVLDHYDNEKEPDDGPFDEQDGGEDDDPFDLDRDDDNEDY